MLKAKSIKRKQKKAPKAKKPRVKKPLPIHQEHQSSHYATKQIHTQGFFNPFPHNTGKAQTSSTSIPHYSSGSGIPYTSTFDSYGITNKPPYFLESYIAKTTEPNYLQPVPSQMSTTVSGSNPKNKPEIKTFETQTKPESVQYVDLVLPAKSQNNENQPDYINLQPEKERKPKQTMKEKLMERAEYRKKNDIPESVKVSPMIREEKMKEVERKRKEFIKEKKRLRGSGAKKNEEL